MVWESGNQSGRKGRGLWRKKFAEEQSLEFRIKYWTSKRRRKRWERKWWRWWTAMCDRWSTGDCVWRDSRRSVGNSFHRQGAAYRKERLMIFREVWVGGRARGTIDKERVLWQGWTEIKTWGYWGWFVLRTL